MKLENEYKTPSMERAWERYCNAKSFNPTLNHFCIKENYLVHGVHRYNWGQRIVVLTNKSNDFKRGEILTLVNPNYKIGDTINPHFNIKMKYGWEHIKYIKVLTENDEEKFLYCSIPFCTIEEFRDLEYKLDHPNSTITYKQYLQQKEYKYKIKNGEITKGQQVLNIIYNILFPCCWKTKITLIWIIPICLVGSVFYNRILIWIGCGLWYITTNLICFFTQQRDNL